MPSEMTKPRTIAWTPAMAASSGSFSPVRLATMAVVDMETPSPMAITSASMDSGEANRKPPRWRPGGPPRRRRRRQKSDSSTISRTMGMASRRMAVIEISLGIVSGVSHAELRTPRTGICARRRLQAAPQWFQEQTLELHNARTNDGMGNGSGCGQIATFACSHPGLEDILGVAGRWRLRWIVRPEAMFSG